MSAGENLSIIIISATAFIFILNHIHVLCNFSKSVKAVKTPVNSGTTFNKR